MHPYEDRPRFTIKDLTRLRIFRPPSQLHYFHSGGATVDRASPVKETSGTRAPTVTGIPLSADFQTVVKMTPNIQLAPCAGARPSAEGRDWPKSHKPGKRQFGTERDDGSNRTSVGHAQAKNPPCGLPSGSRQWDSRTKRQTRGSNHRDTDVKGKGRTREITRAKNILRAGDQRRLERFS